MILRVHEAGPRRSNRRAFLRGAAGVSLALPFLESLPDRSAWAAGNAPVCALFICGVGGIVPEQFFPDTPGALTSASLASASKATSALAELAERLLFVSGVRLPPSVGNDSHADYMCGALTATRVVRTVSDTGTCTDPANCYFAAGPSADWAVSSRTTPGQAPFVLRAGPKSDFITDRLSFSAAGKVEPGIINPFDFYKQLIGLGAPGESMTPQGDAAARALLESRKSIHDLVRNELKALMAHPRLGSADKQHLQLHFDSIRDLEIAMGGMASQAAEACDSQGLPLDKLQALESYVWTARRTDEIAALHMGLVAFAFSCNLGRAASLQWGDPYDGTIYDVPSNARGWKMNFIQHRIMSDSAVGDDPTAAQAHAEIDAVRMTTLKAGLDQFAARGLAERSLVLWTNEFSDGPMHSPVNVPNIIWGSAGGYLRQGQYMDLGDVGNNRLLNTLITAAVRDTGQTVEDFGQGTPGQLLELLA